MPLTPLEIAQAFAELGDDGQAQVLIEVARIDKWKYTEVHWCVVGRHLRMCSCSTDEARALVRNIAKGMEADHFGHPLPGSQNELA